MNDKRHNKERMKVTPFTVEGEEYRFTAIFKLIAKAIGIAR